MANVADASPSVAEAAKNGPHGGWASFDCRLEGARFHLLHEIVSAETFDAAEAERLAAELEELALSYGYGAADNYLAKAEGLQDDEIGEDPSLALQRRSIFEEDGEEDAYFAEVRASERLLFAAAATGEAEAFLGAGFRAANWDGAFGPLHERMKAAFVRGRDMRAAQSFRKPSP